MDEQSLGAALQTYQAQLEQVERTLQAGADPSHQADLIQLKGDLQQLIELTESSLLSVQKCNLLTSLDGPSSTSTHDEEYEAFRMAINESSQDAPSSGANDEVADSPEGSEEEEEEEEDDDDDDDNTDDTCGLKVKAPYYSTWGTLEYHNAMIVGSEKMEDGSAGVRVLYLYPTHKAMKPCPYFLDGKCRFHDSCRFSHGQVVSVDELQTFADPDVSSLGVDSLCLAKRDDGIWYPGRITAVEDGFYTVKFDSLLQKELVLEADAVIPPLRASDDSSSSDEDEGAEVSGYAKVLVDGEKTGTAPCSSAFAGWEAHTRGIGSKLLARMGYEFGKGLGRNAEGRVEPVQAVVLPKGKSLDQCLEIQQRKRSKGQNPPRVRRRRRAAGQNPADRRSVFDFLNEKLVGKPHGDQTGRSSSGTERKGKELYNASAVSKRALNVQVAKTAEQIQQKQREIGQLTGALARNVGRDSVLSSQLELRLASARSQLAGLQQEERTLQREQKKADTHKKMTEF
ncbi:zinc finger CCCH-type with G patch domain-containing protein [Spea bombifrons]|uniref:zinc finger CCCH-type with G patch domain-containing protein n=1 Tax=Spea bombifrons TaxID=233779 RepID=UPI0023495133|nr:zinc finger CCCH-type with G patch domain-containing protein [Spea bombifrons]XP_053309258.1 zinc finger CCCH-type with G patch domain-containing protein [Spea bombifrons]XP_053309259.1 zinc finger CCCH-type with G patch domain-containing protein [Spea bombifrons]